MSDTTLINGDCLEYLPDIPDKSIDMILADPPYGTTACKWDSVIPLQAMWEQLPRLISPRGAIVMTATQPFTTALIHSNLDMFKYAWVWEKEQSHTPLNSKFQPLKVHEDIVVFSKSPSTYSKNGTMRYNPQMTEGRPYRGTTAKQGAHTFHGNIDVDFRKDNKGTRFPRSVIFCKRETGHHPTQKPVALMEYLIRTYTDAGDTVLDFCMGSGTTGVACQNTDRRFIGIEKDPDYFEMAQERIEKTKFRQAEFIKERRYADSGQG